MSEITEKTAVEEQKYLQERRDPEQGADSKQEEDQEKEADPGQEIDTEEESEVFTEETDEEFQEEEAGTSTKPVKDVFDLKTFEPLLKSDEEYFEDFGEEDKEECPELFMTDEELEKVFQDMTDTEKKQYLALKDFHLKEYMQKGRITPLSEIVQAVMKESKPNIPTTSTEQQAALRDRLLHEARKMAELRERGMDIKPPKRIKTEYQGPAFSESKDDKGNITITLLPGRDPYAELNKENEDVIDITGAESETDVNEDFESADDISVVSLDSLAAIDKEKIKGYWKEMSEVKAKEATIYNNLSEMVEDMSPAVIQETVKRTPKPGSNIPQVIEDLYEEIGNGSKFKKIVAAGYMLYELYLTSRDEKYKPLTYRQVAKKFQVDIKGLKEIRRGAAYQRDKKRLERVVKKEEGDVKPEVTPEEAEEPESEQTKGVKRKRKETQ